MTDLNPEITERQWRPLGDTAGESVAHRSPLRLAWLRFRSHKLALASAIFLVILVLSAIAAPWLTPYEPQAINLDAYRQPPSAEHWLGTDSAGRDVLTRMLYASRVSLTVGLTAALAAGTIGLILGTVAGTVGGRVDGLVMRVADVVFAFPSLVMMLVFTGFLGPGIRTIILAIAILDWPTSCRIVRGVTLSLREREYVEAARAIGSSELRLMVKHIVPSVLPPLLVSVTLLVAGSILAESGLSFLGLGIQPPTPSWGNMLSDAQSLGILANMPWLWLPPGLLIALTVLAVNFVGDGLRDAVDPNQ